MSDMTLYRDHHSLGGPVGQAFSAIADAARANPDRYDLEAMHEALSYMWTFTVATWLIELPDGRPLSIPDAYYKDRRGLRVEGLDDEWIGNRDAHRTNPGRWVLAKRTGASR